MAARLESPDPGNSPGDGRLLAIHSAWDTVGAALLDQGTCVATRQLEGGRAGILLPAAIRDLLQQAGLQPRELQRLAVCIGPGSFTGIKVGLATAFGLSRALALGVTGVDALEILAAQAPDDTAVVVLLPAGRGELYLAAYGAAAGSMRPVLRPPCLLAQQEARAELHGRVAIHLGCEALVTESGLAKLLPGDPAGLAETLGRRALLRPDPGPGPLPQPLYLRRTWAEEARDRKLAGSGG